MRTTFPLGVSFVDNNDGTGTFDWTPGLDQSGSYPVIFEVQDSFGFDSQTVVITVNPTANQAPVLAEIGPKTVDEGVTLNIALSATDPDGTFPSFAIENIPAGASLVDNGDGTGVFEWATTYADAGNYQLLFMATDGALADSEYVDITVINVNRAPVIITNASDTTIDECGSVQFSLCFVPDPDEQVTSMWAEVLVGGMTFEVIDTLGTFTFTPDTTMAGVYPVMVMATDGEDTSMVGFIVTVEECTI